MNLKPLAGWDESREWGSSELFVYKDSAVAAAQLETTEPALGLIVLAIMLSFYLGNVDMFLTRTTPILLCPSLPRWKYRSSGTFKTRYLKVGSTSALLSDIPEALLVALWKCSYT